MTRYFPKNYLRNYLELTSKAIKNYIVIVLYVHSTELRHGVTILKTMCIHIFVNCSACDQCFKVILYNPTGRELEIYPSQPFQCNHIVREKFNQFLDFALFITTTNVDYSSCEPLTCAGLQCEFTKLTMTL